MIKSDDDTGRTRQWRFVVVVVGGHSQMLLNRVIRVGHTHTHNVRTELSIWLPWNTAVMY